jgi:hypothetical protein
MGLMGGGGYMPHLYFRSDRALMIISRDSPLCLLGALNNATTKLISTEHKRAFEQMEESKKPLFNIQSECCLWKWGTIHQDY